MATRCWRWPRRSASADRVKLLPMAPPGEMVRLAADYDIGLSLETDVSENRRICLTNKIFTYLLAGVPVVMSDTPAQSAAARRSRRAAAARAADRSGGTRRDARSLALAGRPRRGLRRRAWRLGRERYNWDREQDVLLQSVAAAFARRETVR